MTWKDYIGCGLILFFVSLGIVLAVWIAATDNNNQAGMAACRAICADDEATTRGGEGRVVQCACPKRGGKAELERP